MIEDAGSNMATSPPRLAAVAEVGRTALRMEELGSFLPMAVRCVTESLNVDASGILELDPTGRNLVMRAAVGCDDAIVGREVPVGRDSISGFTLLEGKPVVVEDMARESRFRPSPLMLELSFRSGMCVCLYDRGRPYGVLSALSRSPRTYTSAEVDFLQVMGNVISGLLGRLRDAEELKRRAGEFEALAENAPDVIGRMSCDLRYLYVNSAVERMTGRPRAWWVGRFIDETGESPELVEIWSRSVKQVFETGQVLEATLAYDTPSGTRWFETRVVPEPGPDGEIESVLWFGRDVTGRLEAERALSEKDAQLAQAQKMEAVGRLAGGIAHDFNNVLTIVQGYAGALRDRFGTDGLIGSEVSEILDAVQRGADLTRRLLAFGRRQILQPCTLDVNEVIAGMEVVAKRMLGDEVTLQLELDPEVGTIHADPGQIEHVLMNFVLNAGDAMDKDGRLTIRTSNLDLDESYLQHHVEVTRGQYVVISVSDNGRGMDAETQARIFDSFYTTKKEGGTGLGLSTVHGIVKQSGGHVTVYSEPGRGTTFKVYLPRVEPPSAQAVTGAAPPILEAESRETVLLVEDEVAVRGAIQRMLDRRGYRVIPVGSMKEALDFSRDSRGSIDILLTDVSMPGGSGLDLAGVLRVERPEMRILFISAYTEHSSAVTEMMKAGAAFLEKPFSAQRLDLAIRQLFEAT